MEMLTVAVELRDGPVIVVLHTQEQIPAAGWAEYIRMTTEHGKRQPAGKPCRGMVLTDGAAPNSKQRAEFAALMATFNPRPLGAVITESTLVRGAVTAIGWVMDVPRAFAPAKFDAALTHLQIPRDEWPQIRAALAEALKRIDCQVAKRVL